MFIVPTLKNIFVFLIPFVSVSNSANFETLTGFFGQKYALVPRARSILIDNAGSLLVLSAESKVIGNFETQNQNGTITVDQALILNGTLWSLNLIHGMAYSNNYLYASTDSTVYRWSYTGGQKEEITSDPETVVFNIPSGMRHTSRTIVFDSEGRLYVQVGSGEDVGNDSSRARIRRFNVSEVPEGGLNFEEAEVIADGVRNNVGMAFDKDGVLWGTDNGPGPFERPDLGGTLTDGNPADELNRFGVGGSPNGFPYCWSSYELEGYPSGSQFAWPTFLNDGIHDDDWCRNSSNNAPPALALPDHSAALGITFFNGQGCAESEGTGSFPCSYKDNAFIAFHGSNPDYKIIASGYTVKVIHFENGYPTGLMEDIIYEPDTAGCRDTTEKCFRPVDVVFDAEGHLFVSEDMTGEIFRVFYQVPPPDVIYGKVLH